MWKVDVLVVLVFIVDHGEHLRQSIVDMLDVVNPTRELVMCLCIFRSL